MDSNSDLHRGIIDDKCKGIIEEQVLSEVFFSNEVKCW